jgi:hypothetical protein
MKKHHKVLSIIGAAILIIGFSSTIPATTPSSENHQREIETYQTMITLEDWSDNFDTYTLGQYLDGDPEDGGWKGWDANPDAGAYVVDVQSRSTPHSLESTWNAGYAVDLVHEFTGVDSGQWNFTAWQYIPGDFDGVTNFLLLNTYVEGGPHNNPDWSNALAFDSDAGVIRSWEGATLPLIFDQWVEIRIEIDFEIDNQDIYYDDQLLISKSWTAGVAPGGALNLACVDIYAGDTISTPVYYDDLTLIERPSAPEPELEIGEVSGGFGVSAVIANNGDGDATDVEWSIGFDGGIVIPKQKTGTISILEPGYDETASAIVFGLGKPTITISVECAEGSSDERTTSGFVLLFFVLNVQ